MNINKEFFHNSSLRLKLLQSFEQTQYFKVNFLDQKCILIIFVLDFVYYEYN